MELLTTDTPWVQNLWTVAKPKIRTADFPEVGALVRSARKAAGLSQEQVAERSKVGMQAVYNAERGANSTIDTLTKIAKALGYENLIAMIQNPDFRPAYDAQTKRLFELWDLLKHPEARTDALETIALKVARTAEPAATTPST